jgi:phosphate transport system permease protein
MTDGERPPDLSGDRGLQSVRETAYGGFFLVSAVLSVLTTFAIVLALLGDTGLFFSEVSVGEFLTGLDWSPGITPREFGVIPLVYGTVIVTIGASAIALPIGLLTAIYLSEYASQRVRSVLKPALEVLAGVPTVVYGYFALVYVTPLIRQFLFPSISTFNALSASFMMGIMIVPMVASISEDAMSAVPDSLRQAGYGLGATKFNVSTTIVVPAAISGIVSSFILAISRAIGETMIVVVAMGASARLPPVRQATLFGLQLPFVHPADVYLEPGMTMTVGMVQVALSDLSGGTAAYHSLFAIGLTLFFITLVMNVVSDIIASRYREEY